MDGKRIEAVEDRTIPKPRLYDFYLNNVVPELKKKFDYTNAMEVPKIEKISLNMGMGEAVSDPKVLQNAINEIELITGQRPVVRKAKNSISNFKLREGMPIGVSVTLRRTIMYEFLDRFINIASPRIRDFRGFSDKSFDGRGNYSIGIKEQIIFPEIDVDKVGRISGFDLTFVTTAKTDEEALALLKEFGFPFIKRDN
ncbi:MAG: 50S ribosomal protein L5 [Ignavibacteria bacterium GWF2_33_9]|nr:MAG: 50S ribosomal protein L5 [Ignavibacteria bacterium GWF2_33_9]